MFKKIMKTASVALLAAAVTVVPLAGCQQNKKTIVVGAKQFAENQIFAKIMEYALEDKGYNVKFVNNLDGDVLYTGIEKGKIDCYPEYTNTGLTEVLKLDPIYDNQKAYDTVKEQYKKKFNITWLDQSSVNDTFCFVMRKETAEKYGIKTLADVVANASNIRAAATSEWDNRTDTIVPVDKTYGKLNFKSRDMYDDGLKYNVLFNGKADLTLGYTTDPQLKDSRLVTIQDPKNAWPPYFLAPIIRQQVLDKYPDVAKILNEITAKITMKDMIDLNAQVSISHKEFGTVAKDYYNSKIKK